MISLFDIDDDLKYAIFRIGTSCAFLRLQELTIQDYNYSVIQSWDLLLFAGCSMENNLRYNFGVRALDLSCNHLTDISIFYYRHQFEIESINLSWNKLEFIQGGVFHDMHRLAEVDLSHNMLINLPLDSEYIYPFKNAYANQNILAYMTGIQVLNFSNNHLRNIPARFSTNGRLGILDLSSNEIMQVEELCFYELVGLVILDISRNYLQKLSFGESLLDNGLVERHEVIKCSLSIFEGLNNLRTLNISHNNVTYLSQTAFCHLTRLEILDLAWNHIHFLSRNVFKNLGSLTCLILRGNHIQIIESSTFISLHEVNSINLEANQLSDLSDNLFDANSNLTLLQLRDNNLTTVPLVVSKWIQGLFGYLHWGNYACLNPQLWRPEGYCPFLRLAVRLSVHLSVRLSVRQYELALSEE